MKTSILALAAVLSLSTAAAQADGRNCLSDAPAPAARQVPPAEMGKIEAALHGGQITPYEAGRLMRQQWELSQFQRGFQEGAPQPRGKVAGREGCGLGNIDISSLGDMAGNVAGSMAKNGVQTAGTVMRALIRETERLIQERAAAEDTAL